MTARVPTFASGATRGRPTDEGLRITGLTVRYGRGDGAPSAVRGVDLAVAPGETVGLVGESGSGKTTLALAALRALPEAGHITDGSVTLNGDDVTAMNRVALRDLWHRRVKLVPQNPLPSMNPSHRVGRQLGEALDPRRPGRADVRRIDDMLERVGLADPARVRGSYPFELSGGMQQRVMIAMALLSDPELLVMDEPTTNLDVTTEAGILELVRDLVRDASTAVLYVSHSLGVVAQLCDRVDVLYAGEIIETAPVHELYRAPRHPYTVGLLDAVPTLERRGAEATLRPIPGRIPAPTGLPPGCLFAPRCPAVEPACRKARPPLEAAGEGRRVACRRWTEIIAGIADPHQEAGPSAADRLPSGGNALHASEVDKRFPVRRGLAERLRGVPPREVHALHDVDLDVRRGRTLGLVGESGSGKSTFSRTTVGLIPADGGRIELLGVPLARRLEERDEDVIRQLQMVFQSSEEALNPHRTVGETLERPFRRLAGLSRGEARERTASLLRSVQLGPEYARRRPDELSGGEKQRVAIARAFASDPELILFDESVSGLDVSVQAAVLNLLVDLQRQRRTSYLFISHDLSVVAHVSDDIAVLYRGRVMESGPADAVLQPPWHPYTESLLAAVPRPDPSRRTARDPLRGDAPSPQEARRGCPFASRCPRVLGDVCRDVPPPVRTGGDGHRVLCHIPLEELEAAQRAAAEEE